jgi:hypothetical protein
LTAATLPLEDRIRIVRHVVQVSALSEIAASARSWRDAMQRASLRRLAAADAIFDPQLATAQLSFVAQYKEMMLQPLQLLVADEAIKSVTLLVGQALWEVAWEPLVKSFASDAALVRDCSCSMLRHRLKSVEAAGAKPLKKGPGGCSFIVDSRNEGSSSSAGGGMVALFKASVHKQSSDWSGVYGDDHIPSGYEWQKAVLSSSSFVFCGFGRLSSSCPLQLLAGLNTKSLMLASIFAAAVNETSLRRQGRLDTVLTPQEKQVNAIFLLKSSFARASLTPSPRTPSFAVSEHVVVCFAAVGSRCQLRRVSGCTMHRKRAGGRFGRVCGAASWWRLCWCQCNGRAQQSAAFG